MTALSAVPAKLTAEQKEGPEGYHKIISQRVDVFMSQFAGKIMKGDSEGVYADLHPSITKVLEPADRFKHSYHYHYYRQWNSITAVGVREMTDGCFEVVVRLKDPKVSGIMEDREAKDGRYEVWYLVETPQGMKVRETPGLAGSVRFLGYSENPDEKTAQPVTTENAGK